MKKTVRILALVMMLAMCFAAYGCSKPSENEVLNAYKELYPKARLINEYVYGAGLPYDGEYDLEKLSSPYYVPVSESAPYKTAEELKAAILEVYSEDYYEETLKYVLFESIAGDENGMTSSAAPRYKEVGGTLQINVKYEKSLTLIECDADGAYIVEIKSRSAIVGAPRQGQTKDKSCYMVLTEKGWRFDYLA